MEYVDRIPFFLTKNKIFMKSGHKYDMKLPTVLFNSVLSGGERLK